MSDKKQSEALTKFYQSYLQWVDSGAEEYEPFSRGVGLCSNLHSYVSKMRFEPGFETTVYSDLSCEMRDQFYEAGLCVVYPFSHSMDDYEMESIRAESHTNSDRLKWVRSHCQ